MQCPHEWMSSKMDRIHGKLGCGHSIAREEHEEKSWHVCLLAGYRMNDQQGLPGPSRKWVWGQRRTCDKGLKTGLRRLDSEQGGNRKLFQVFHQRHGLIMLLFWEKIIWKKLTGQIRRKTEILYSNRTHCSSNTFLFAFFLFTMITSGFCETVSSETFLGC